MTADKIDGFLFEFGHFQQGMEFMLQIEASVIAKQAWDLDDGVAALIEALANQEDNAEKRVEQTLKLSAKAKKFLKRYK